MKVFQAFRHTRVEAAIAAQADGGFGAELFRFNAVAQAND